MVKKFMVEKSGVEKSGVEISFNLVKTMIDKMLPIIPRMLNVLRNTPHMTLVLICSP
jgi:hypothetical protein